MIKKINFDNKIHDIWFIFTIIFIVLIAASPLFNGLLIVTHETISPLTRISELNQYIGDGQLFVRWMPDLSRGYGYPLFNFYSPLFYYLTYLFSLLGLGLVSLFNSVSIILWMISGLGMYLFCREFFGKYGALICSTAYIYAPYHIADLYVRGASAEFASLAIFPFILWSFYKLSINRNYKYVIFSAVTVSLLVLSHNVMTLLFVPLTFVYILFLYLFNQDRSKRTLFASMTALFVGLALSAFFWAPAILEKESVQISSMTEGYYNYTNHFVYPDQFLVSDWGYGPSLPGRDDGMSFKIGGVHILLGLLSLAAIKAIYYKSKSGGLHIGFFAMTLFLSVYLATSSSLFIWDNLSLLQFSQFPWRFLSLIIFSISFIAGGMFLLIKKELFRIVAAIAGTLLIVLVNLPYCSPQQYYKNIENTQELSREVVNDPAVSSFAHYFSDYTPKWVEVPPETDPKEKLTILSGDSEISYIRVNSITHKFKLNVASDSTFRFNEFYFPGLTLKIDDQKQEASHINENGFLEFGVSKGEHDVDIVFSNTPIRWLSITISFLALFLILALFIFNYEKLWKRREDNPKNRFYLSVVIALFLVAVLLGVMRLMIYANDNHGPEFDENIIKPISKPLINYAETISLVDFRIQRNKSDGSGYGNGRMSYFDFGIKYGENGEHTKAIAEFEKVISLDHNFIPAYINLGTAYLNLNDADKAIESYEKVIELGAGDKNSSIYLNLAAAYANFRKDFDKAVFYLEKYVELDPESEQIEDIRNQIESLRSQ